jgi:hypothetical protein
MRAAIATLVTVYLYGGATAVLAQTAYDPARTRYAVEGLAVGVRLSAERAAYREYRCSRSAQFELFSLCQKVRNDRERRGSYRVFESMLLSQKGDVSYISRYQEPAFFDPAEADGSIERYSREIGETPRVMRVAERFAHVDGILAVWGSATLEPLDQETLKLLEEGKSPKNALLIDLIGNLARSAKEGLPIYRVGGRAGLIWVAGFDQGGRGTLRFAAVDASELASAAEGLAVSPVRAAPQPAPAQPISPNAPEAQVRQAELPSIEKPRTDPAVAAQKMVQAEPGASIRRRETTEPVRTKVASGNHDKDRPERSVEAKPAAPLAPAVAPKTRTDPGTLAWKVFALVAFLMSVAGFLALNRSNMRTARYPI